MRENRNRKAQTDVRGGNAPAFSVQDEIRRNRRIALNKRIRRGRAMRRKVLAIALSLFVVFFTLLAVVFTVTHTRDIAVSGNSRYTAEEIIQAAGIDGDILLLLSDNSVYKKVVAACPYVNDVELKKTYPSTVEIVVTETEVVYYSYLRTIPYSLDENLRVIETTENNDGLVLLMLPNASKAIEGESLVFVDDRYNTLIPEILSELFGEYTLPFVTVDLSNRFSFTAAVEGNVKIDFGDYNDLTLKLKAASKLIQTAKEQGSEKTYINVSSLTGTGPSMILDYEGQI